MVVGYIKPGTIITDALISLMFNRGYKMYSGYNGAAMTLTDVSNCTVSNCVFEDGFLKQGNISLDTCPTVAYPKQVFTPEYYSAPNKATCCANKKKENPMSRIDLNVSSFPAPSTESEAQAQRRYLESRLDSLFSVADIKLLRQFGLSNDAPPTKMSDFVSRIKEGKFVFEEKKMDKDYWSFYNLVDRITWRDPSVKEDRAGYDEALKALKAKYQEAQDTIRIASPTEGLAALREFEKAVA